MPTDWTLRDEIYAAERRLVHYCNLVEAGQAQGGGREFLRRIDAQFRAIKEHLPPDKLYRISDDGELLVPNTDDK